MVGGGNDCWIFSVGFVPFRFCFVLVFFNYSYLKTSPALFVRAGGETGGQWAPGDTPQHHPIVGNPLWGSHHCFGTPGTTMGHLVPLWDCHHCHGTAVTSMG